MTDFTPIIAIVFIAAYLVGSLSAAIITCKLMGLPDPRSTGSGNPGATNVLRSGGKKAAAITLIGDMLKGLLPVVLVHFLYDDANILAAAALGAFLGHLFPVFFRFAGGKGVATALGALLGLSWLTGLLAIATWLAASLSIRISSLSALITFSLAPLYLWLLGGEIVLVYLLIVIAGCLYWRHRSNIRNLLDGSEPRIGEKKKA